MGYRTQCRYCKHFRYGEIIVIDVSTGCQETYDGVCLDELRRHDIIPVNLSDDCPNYKSRMEGIKK